MVELQGNIQSAIVAADRLNDVLALSVESYEGEDLAENIESIDFKDIDFRYGNRELVLKKFSFDFKGGEKVAFIAPFSS